MSRSQHTLLSSLIEVDFSRSRAGKLLKLSHDKRPPRILSQLLLKLEAGTQESFLKLRQHRMVEGGEEMMQSVMSEGRECQKQRVIDVAAVNCCGQLVHSEIHRLEFIAVVKHFCVVMANVDTHRPVNETRQEENEQPHFNNVPERCVAKVKHHRRHHKRYQFIPVELLFVQHHGNYPANDEHALHKDFIRIKSS